MSILNEFNKEVVVGVGSVTDGVHYNYYHNVGNVYYQTDEDTNKTYISITYFECGKVLSTQYDTRNVFELQVN